MKRKIIRVLRVLQRMLSARPVYANISFLSPHKRLVGRRILITGGSKGIGFAIAKKCADEGAYTVITGRNEQDLARAASEIGGGYKILDMRNISLMGDIFSMIKKDFGPIDTLVCNAGISLHETSFEMVTPESFDAQFITNFKSNYFLSQYFLKSPESRNLLFISSETADMCCNIPYGLTKNVLNSLVGALSRRYYVNGKRINAIAPGSTLTNMVKNTNADTSDISYNNAAGRYFLPEEIAEVATFLLCDASRCISGEIIHTNAGNHIRPQS